MTIQNSTKSPWLFLCDECAIKSNMVEAEEKECNKESNTETITWIAVKNKLPDDELTVMIWHDSEVWFGYMSENVYRFADGAKAKDGSISHWAEMPKGPQQ